MKLLFDQNISFRVLKRIHKLFPETNQVKDLGLTNCSDIELWNFSKANGYSIVTYDSDFFDISNLYGHPPKIIWLRTGNRKTNEIVELLISRSEIIQEFISNPIYKELACIEIHD